MARTSSAVIPPRPTAFSLCADHPDSRDTYNDDTNLTRRNFDAVNHEAYVNVELRSNSGALAAACWGYVPQEPVRSSWFPFDPVAQNMSYQLTGSILRYGRTARYHDSTSPHRCRPFQVHRLTTFSCSAEISLIEQLMTQVSSPLLKRVLAPSGPRLLLSPRPSRCGSI